LNASDSINEERIGPHRPYVIVRGAQQDFTGPVKHGDCLIWPRITSRIYRYSRNLYGGHQYRDRLAGWVPHQRSIQNHRLASDQTDSIVADLEVATRDDPLEPRLSSDPTGNGRGSSTIWLAFTQRDER
jgi:hypothetical protein